MRIAFLLTLSVLSTVFSTSTVGWNWFSSDEEKASQQSPQGQGQSFRRSQFQDCLDRYFIGQIRDIKICNAIGEMELQQLKMENPQVPSTPIPKSCDSSAQSQCWSTCDSEMRSCENSCDGMITSGGTISAIRRNDCKRPCLSQWNGCFNRCSRTHCPG